jgi:catechol 2,3-dioxygenase-like lactoylglutathione lyase family enzyme
MQPSGTATRESRMSRADQVATAAGSAAGIDHIGILVRDLPSAISYFQETFGLALVAEETLPVNGMKAAYLGATDGALLQLIEPGPGSQFAEELKNGIALHHICVKTNSIRDVLARMHEDERPIVPGGRGMQVCFPEHRPFGVTIELAESGVRSGEDDL